MKPFSLKQNAVRAAKRELGGEAVNGSDFRIVGDDSTGYTWEVIGQRVEAGSPARPAAPELPADEGRGKVVEVEVADGVTARVDADRALGVIAAAKAAKPAATYKEALKGKPAKAPVAGNAAQAKAEKALDKKRAAKPVNETRAMARADAAARKAERKAKAAKPKPEKREKGSPSHRIAKLFDEARAGHLPAEPVFGESPVRSSWANKTAEVTRLMKEKDVAGLQALNLPTYDSGIKRIALYRDLAVTALQAKAAKAERKAPAKEVEPA